MLADSCDFNIWRVAFILGGTLNLSLQEEVESEAAQFGDIVQVEQTYAWLDIFHLDDFSQFGDIIQVEQILDNWKPPTWMHLDDISQFGDIGQVELLFALLDDIFHVYDVCLDSISQFGNIVQAVQILAELDIFQV